MTPPRVLLSFAAAYADLARRWSAALRENGVDVRLDPWDGGGGVPGVQRVPQAVNDLDFVVPLLTPSDAAPTWVDAAWRTAIFDLAVQRGLAVLPVLGDGPLDAVPAFLRAMSFADLRGPDASAELGRLLRTMRAGRGAEAALPPQDDAVELPSPLAAVAQPLILELGPAWPQPILGARDIAFMVDGLFYELGVHVPPLTQRTDTKLPPWGLRVWINEVPELESQAVGDAVLVSESAEVLAEEGIAAQPASNPANGAPAAWVSASLRDRVRRPDRVTWDLREYMVLTMSAVLRAKAADFMGVSEAEALLSLLEPAFPQLLSQSVPDPVSPLVLSDVLRRLLVEGVGIRNLPNILLTLADRGRTEDDPRMLTEYVRAGLKRQLSHQFGRGQKLLYVLLLDPAIEAEVAAAIRHTATGSYLNLAPSALGALLQAIRDAVQAFPPDAQLPQLLTTMEIRASIRRMVAPSLPLLHVVSYHDLRPDISIQPVGRITRQGLQSRPGVRIGDRLLWT